MVQAKDQASIRCVFCGGERLIPLTVPDQRPKYKRSHRRPVRAVLKCIACGQRMHAHPRALVSG